MTDRQCQTRQGFHLLAWLQVTEKLSWGSMKVVESGKGEDGTAGKRRMEALSPRSM